MSKIHFAGESRVFIRLQIKAKRLDFVMVWPRVEALSWACVSGRIWQPHIRCRHHFWILTNFHSCRKPAWTHPKGWGAEVEPETCTSTNQQQTGLRERRILTLVILNVNGFGSGNSKTGHSVPAWFTSQYLSSLLLNKGQRPRKDVPDNSNDVLAGAARYDRPPLIPGWVGYVPNIWSRLKFPS